MILLHGLTHPLYSWEAGAGISLMHTILGVTIAAGSVLTPGHRYLGCPNLATDRTPGVLD